VAGSGSAASANITPLTEMVTARVLRNEPSVFFAAFDAAVATSKVTTTTVKAAQTDVGTVLTGTLDTSTLGDFISTPLKAATQDNLAGGDAQDKLLDALRKKINAAQLTQVVAALANPQNTDAIKQVVVNLTAAPPVAVAGVSQSVVAGSVVTLDASASSADLGRTLTYAWTLIFKPAGSSASLSSSTSAKPTFTADVAGTYVATVIVNDGRVNSSAAAVSITASTANAAPVANAGVAQNVVAGSVVTLDGSASSDANSDPLTYAWTLSSKPAGSSTALSSTSSAKPTFRADVPGTYIATVIVNDGKVNSAASTVAVTATVANAAPVANAGVAQSVVVGTAVTLNGSASSDANGDSLTYSWTLTSKPAGSTASLTGATSALPTFTADLAGTYVASLIVNDGKLSSTAAIVTVSAAMANVAPVANAGAAQNVLAGAYHVLLDGSASSDANGDQLTYKWTFVSVPADSSPSPFYSGQNTARPDILANVPGTYVISLVVNDGKVNSAASTVTVTAYGIDAAPTAKFNVARSGFVPNSIFTLDGSISTDPNGDILTYAWTLSRPSGSTAVLSSTTSAKPTFTADVVGTYVVTLLVNDGKVNSNPAIIPITATLPPSLTLYSIDPIFGDSLSSMPYNATATSTQTIIGSSFANLGDFKLIARVSDFTVGNLSAIDSTGRVVPFFNNLSNGQVIAAGTGITFSLKSPLTNNFTTSLTYTFTILETGDKFTYVVNFRSN
jgi:hypothetical protein